MTLDIEDLHKKGAELELKELEKFIFDPLFVSTLENLLLDVYAFLRPRPLDYERRKLMVQIFNLMARDIFGGSSGFPVVDAFGSFTMDLFTAASDLDLSVNFSNEMVDFPRDKKISVLRTLTRKLRVHQGRGLVSGIVPVLHARVPVLKVIDNGTRIECDISVENKDGISRSMILSVVSSIDERFRILSYLVKFWAKVHEINSSKDGTLSSLSIVSLVAFHLQTRNPPILPPFSMLLKDGTDASSVQNLALEFKNFGGKNTESIAELFLTLLSKLLSVEALWSHGLCASIYEGSWISKTWKSRAGNISVEDFLDRSENVARSVGKVETEKIYKCIRSSSDYLLCFMNGEDCEIGASKLKKLMFGSDCSNMPASQVVKNQEVNIKRSFPIHDSAAPHEPSPSKRKRYTEVTNELHHPHYQKPSSSRDLSIPLRPPALPFQSMYGIHHQEYKPVPFRSDYMSWYHPRPPIAPEIRYSPHGFPELPFPRPGIFCGSEEQPHPLFSSHFEFGHRPPFPHPFPLNHGLQHHHHYQNLMHPRPWNNGYGNLQSDFYNNGVEHPHHPYVRHPMAYGPNYM